METIFALSSGRPPAAIAIVRISGPDALSAAAALAGTLPEARRAGLRTLRDGTGEVLDRALVLAFPGPSTATGEDLVELHLHGGRAVVTAVEAALAAQPGLRAAQPGEFTRRSLENGRVDWAQAQGLADLLSAETEGERRAAMAATEGAVGREMRGWMDRLSDAAARIEASIDYAEEIDEAAALEDIREILARLVGQMREVCARPTVERLREGAVVVLAGPPNAGKSSLFNAMLSREASIVTNRAGTTRDVIEAQVVRGGYAYRLVDTAGLAEATDDPIEQIGIERARRVIDGADLLLWLGDPSDCPAGAVQVRAKSDLRHTGDGIPVSARLPRTVDHLWQMVEQATADRTIGSDVRLHDDQRRSVMLAAEELASAGSCDDVVVAAEHVRRALRLLAMVMGMDATEAMLNALFSRFCLGK